MKKYIIGAVITIAIIAIIITVATTPVIATTTVADGEPWGFHVSYLQDGKFIEKQLSKENFGETIELRVDADTGVHIGICSYESNGFYLTETVWVVFEGEKMVNAKNSSNMGNEWLYLTAGQSGIATINCGTELNPEWVTFKIETVVE